MSLRRSWMDSLPLHHRRRRLLLSNFMFAGSWRYAVLGIACVAATPISPSLRTDADRAGILVGAGARPEQLSEPTYAATLAREFNMLEPEDVMKWETIHPAPETFDFSKADRLVAFAISHQMKVRGHTLTWHQQNPKWLNGQQRTPEQLARILEQH